jgi:chloramphenicol 3-O phosphotransferase
VDELERRERTRGDRPIGDARRDFESVHAHCSYDTELDATSLAPEINAERLLEQWRERATPSAFDRAARRRQKRREEAGG